MSGESPDPTTRSAEWLCEALADMTERLGEPVMIIGLADLVREVRRCAAALERIAAAQEAGEAEEEV